MEVVPSISTKPFRILSIDGGGLRGLIVAQILQWIESNVLGTDANGKQKSITDSFDLFAGTSTGGLIACALTVRDRVANTPLYSLSDIIDLYQNSGSIIFPSSTNKFRRGYKWLQNKFAPKHSRDGLIGILNQKLEGKRILDCSKNIFIPTYNVARFKPIYFTSRLAKDSSVRFQRNADKYNCKLLDVCLATSAAPTYLPSYVFEYTDENGYNETINCIDGGVYLNNPALAAYIEVLSNSFYYRGVPQIDKSDIYILSIGTGKVPKNISKRSGENWGEIRWAKNVVAAAMQGNSQTIEDHLYSLLPGRYLRINLDIDPLFSEMDDSSLGTINHLLQVFKKEFAGNPTWLTQLLAFKNLANL